MSMFDEKPKKHPSYGMLGFYRYQGSSARPLFGSSIKHNNLIRLVLKEGSVRRDLHRDWYYGDKTLYEVEMSATQFADLISNMNCGDGVPVTILRTENNWQIPECPFESKGEMHLKEFAESIDENSEYIKKSIDIMESLLSKKSVTKKDREEILDLLYKVKMDINSNRKFQLRQFQEQMANTTVEAKGEIEAFFQNKLLTIAQQSMVENPEKFIEGCKSPIELEEKVSEE